MSLFVKGIAGSIVAGGVLVGGGFAYSKAVNDETNERILRFSQGRDSREPEIIEVKHKTNELKREVSTLVKDNEDLEKDNDKLTRENNELKAKVKQLTEQLEKKNNREKKCDEEARKGYYGCPSKK